MEMLSTKSSERKTGDPDSVASCHYCKRSFNSVQEAIDHINQEHEMTTWYNCVTCKLNVLDAKVMKEHILNVHKFDISLTDVKKLAIKDPELIKKLREIEWATTKEKSYVEPNDMNYNMEVEYDDTNQQPENEDFENRNAEQIWKDQDANYGEQSFEVKDQFEAYGMRSDFEQSKSPQITMPIDYSDFKPLKHPKTCQYCGFKAAYPSMLLQHINCEHEMTTWYRCDYCYKAFTNLDHFKLHSLKVHACAILVSEETEHVITDQAEIDRLRNATITKYKCTPEELKAKLNSTTELVFTSVNNSDVNMEGQYVGMKDAMFDVDEDKECEPEEAESNMEVEDYGLKDPLSIGEDMEKPQPENNECFEDTQNIKPSKQTFEDQLEHVELGNGKNVYNNFEKFKQKDSRMGMPVNYSDFKPLKHPKICQYCGFYMKQPSKLLLHINSKHEMTTWYKCIDCRKAFRVFINLKIHAANLHGRILRLSEEKEHVIKDQNEIDILRNQRIKKYLKQNARRKKHAKLVFSSNKQTEMVMEWPEDVMKEAMTSEKDVETPQLENNDCYKDRNAEQIGKYQNAKTCEQTFEDRLEHAELGNGKNNYNNFEQFKQKSYRMRRPVNYLDFKPMKHPNICQYCGIQMKTSTSVLRHINSQHEMTTWYKCIDCHKTFRDFGNLRSHTTMVHGRSLSTSEEKEHVIKDQNEIDILRKLRIKEYLMLTVNPDELRSKKHANLVSSSNKQTETIMEQTDDVMIETMTTDRATDKNKDHPQKNGKIKAETGEDSVAFSMVKKSDINMEGKDAMFDVDEDNVHESEHMVNVEDEVEGIRDCHASKSIEPAINHDEEAENSMEVEDDGLKYPLGIKRGTEKPQPENNECFEDEDTELIGKDQNEKPCEQTFEDQLEHVELGNGKNIYNYEQLKENNSRMGRPVNYSDFKPLKHPKICQYCGVRMNRPASLLVHINSQHEMTTWYKCIDCHKPFRDFYYFKSHASKVHGRIISLSEEKEHVIKDQNEIDSLRNFRIKQYLTSNVNPDKLRLKTDDKFVYISTKQIETIMGQTDGAMKETLTLVSITDKNKDRPVRNSWIEAEHEDSSVAFSKLKMLERTKITEPEENKPVMLKKCCGRNHGILIVKLKRIKMTEDLQQQLKDMKALKRTL